MEFSEIPFSEIEAQLIVEVGTWKNFDEIEESLILDELLLLTEKLGEKRHHEMRVVLMGQGIDIDEHEGQDMQDADLPDEVLEAERAFKAKKQAALEEAAKEGTVSMGDGLGYEVVS